MLWLDIGNTRIKWQLDTDDGVLAGAADHAGGAALAQAPIWAELLPETTVWVASVASPALRDQLTSLCQAAGCPRVQWAAASAELAGLRNRYEDPTRLGIDRWLAMLAAWREQQAPCLIIDAGSAITVDWLDGDGGHRGGHIVPGLGLLTQALRQGTAGVRANWLVDANVGPGASTDAAVSHGCLAMATGYLRYIIDSAWSGAEGVRLLLCGGDGPLLEPFLPRPAQWRANLVLDGLREYARLHGEGG